MYIGLYRYRIGSIVQRNVAVFVNSVTNVDAGHETLQEEHSVLTGP